MLAKLSDMKAMMGWAGSGKDEDATRAITYATAIANQLAGLPPGTMERQTVTLYPWDPRGQSRILRLSSGPIEAITSVKQRFDAATAWDDVDALIEDTDYMADAQTAVLERINSEWYADRRKLVAVEGVFGYADPNDELPDEASVYPPDAFQHGILEQAQLLDRRRNLIGTGGITMGQGGAINLEKMEVVESLRNAVKSLPFVRIF